VRRSGQANPLIEACSSVGKQSGAGDVVPGFRDQVNHGSELLIQAFCLTLLPDVNSAAAKSPYDRFRR